MKKVGTKEEVFLGLAKHTPEGFTRTHLIIGHNGKVVVAPSAKGGMWDPFHLSKRGKPFFFSH
jgi:hypothetical protein